MRQKKLILTARAAKKTTQINGTRLSTMKRQKAKNKVELKKNKERKNKKKQPRKQKRCSLTFWWEARRAKALLFPHVASDIYGWDYTEQLFAIAEGYINSSQ